jgi:hypothetical protein
MAEEMEKAMADLDDLYARIPDECKFYCTEAEEYIKKKEEREEKEEKKSKKLCVMPPYKVQMILNYKCRPLDKHKGLELLEEEDKEKYKDLRTLFTVCDTFTRHHHDFMRSCQEKIRHEYETKAGAEPGFRYRGADAH